VALTIDRHARLLASGGAAEAIGGFGGAGFGPGDGALRGVPAVIERGDMLGGRDADADAADAAAAAAGDGGGGGGDAAEVARLLRGLRPSQIALVGACMRDTAVAYTGDAAG
jgi:hypothetical protein